MRPRSPSRPKTAPLAAIRLAVLLISATASGAAPAAAQDWRAVANAFDEERIAAHDEAFESARAEAEAGGRPFELKQLVAAIGLPPQPIETDGLEGAWRCHSIKMGGLLPIVTYRWFDCRIERDAEGLMLRKLSGSQRTNGRFYPDPEDPTRMIYLGAKSYGGESVITQYSGPEGALGASYENRDTPGVLTQRDKDLLTIGFPKPVVESTYDILVLKR